MNIYGKKVVLKAIEEDDLPQLHKWSNDPNIQYMLGGWHLPSSMKNMSNWLDRIQNDILNQRFSVFTEDLGLIGTANLVEINWKDRNAFHGMLLGDKDMRGKGYGIDTIMALMRYSFEELGLNRLDGSMISYNDISISIYTKKCGWKIEGTQKNWYYRKGKYHDRVIVGITKDDYFQLIEKNNYW